MGHSYHLLLGPLYRFLSLASLLDGIALRPQRSCGSFDRILFSCSLLSFSTCFFLDRRTKNGINVNGEPTNSVLNPYPGVINYGQPSPEKRFLINYITAYVSGTKFVVQKNSNALRQCWRIK